MTHPEFPNLSRNTLIVKPGMTWDRFDCTHCAGQYVMYRVEKVQQAQRDSHWRDFVSEHCLCSNPV